MIQLLWAACLVGSLLERAPERVARDNPYATRPSAARAGAKLFQRECAACHGKAGEGLGTAPPLRSARIAKASPDALFWVLRNGSMRRGMPSFAHLPEPQRWQIIAYLQRNGLSVK